MVSWPSGGVAKGVLITQCIQRDFVGRLGPDEPLPNLVHVGRLEAERLVGRHGALLPVLDAAHAAPDLAVIHVVDQHDPVRDAAHFELFRPHCVAGTEGAAAVGPSGGRLVAAADLNDFEQSSLASALHEVGATPQTPIGVIGVWTDAKVSFLLYDLRTRFGARRLATCSGLTASRSIDAHWRALESLSAVLGVEVFHSPASFLCWLAPEAPLPRLAPRPAPASLPAPSWWASERVAERDALVAELAGSEGAALTPLGGGFSGAQVFSASDTAGAHVLKIGERDEIARERHGNERVARVLGDVVPTLLAYREGSVLAGMRVALAESDDGASTPATFKRWYESDPSETMTTLLEAALELALDRALGRLYRTAEKDNADLLTTYGFTDARGNPQFVDAVCRNADAVAKDSGAEHARAYLTQLSGAWLAPEDFYSRLAGKTLMREVHPSLVHADLNLANLLLSRRNEELVPSHLWIIDFARLCRLPNLTDFAKIENDLAYIAYRVDDDASFAGALRLQEVRLASPTLELDLESLASTPDQRRHARLVGALRRIAARMDPRGADAMADYRVALLRYAAHTLGFDEPSPRQRGLALLAVGRLSHAVAAGVVHRPAHALP